jgi:hypothetical protein
MKLFLAKVSFVRTHYLDTAEELIESFIVRAKNETDAQAKVEKHFESMDSAYSVNHRVRNCDLTEEIS